MTDPAIVVRGLVKSYGEVRALAGVDLEAPAGVLEAFAEVNPFTIVVDALRALWIGTPAGNAVWGAVLWSVGADPL